MPLINTQILPLTNCKAHLVLSTENFLRTRHADQLEIFWHFLKTKFELEGEQNDFQRTFTSARILSNGVSSIRHNIWENANILIS